jgi:hypothetical protein
MGAVVREQALEVIVVLRAHCDLPCVERASN